MQWSIDSYIIYAINLGLRGLSDGDVDTLDQPYAGQRLA